MSPYTRSLARLRLPALLLDAHEVRAPLTDSQSGAGRVAATNAAAVTRGPVAGAAAVVLQSLAAKPPLAFPDPLSGPLRRVPQRLRIVVRNTLIRSPHAVEWARSGFEPALIPNIPNTTDTENFLVVIDPRAAEGLETRDLCEQEKAARRVGHALGDERYPLASEPLQSLLVLIEDHNPICGFGVRHGRTAAMQQVFE